MRILFKNCIYGVSKVTFEFNTLTSLDDVIFDFMDFNGKLIVYSVETRVLQCIKDYMLTDGYMDFGTIDDCPLEYCLKV